MPVGNNSGAGAAPRRDARDAADILPTLFGAGYGTYAVQPTNFYRSLLIHTVSVALLLWATQIVVQHRAEIVQTISTNIIDVGQYMPMPVSKSTSGGGGSGGDRDKLDASKGVPPKFSNQQL